MVAEAIQSFNDAIVPILKKEGVIINDLYSLSNKDKELPFVLQDGYEIIEVKYASVKGNTVCMKETYAYLELKRK